MKNKLHILSVSILLLTIFSCRSLPDSTTLLHPKAFTDKESRFIDIDGIDVHYKEYGNGDSVLLLIHGMLGSVDEWNKITPELSKEYRLISYDRLAFGLTERPEVTQGYNPYTPEQAEIRALKFMEELDINKPILVGHSSGGNMALRLAISHPKRFSGLVLISPGIYTEMPPALIRELMQIGMFKNMGIDVIRSIPDNIDQLLEETYYDSDIITDEMKDKYLNPTKIINWDNAFWEFLIAQDDSTIERQLKNIHLPILIIHGIEDKVVPVRDNMEVIMHLPNGRLVVLENCGHVAHEEKPTETIEAMRNFFNTINF